MFQSLYKSIRKQKSMIKTQMICEYQMYQQLFYILHFIILSLQFCLYNFVFIILYLQFCLYNCAFVLFQCYQLQQQLQSDYKQNRIKQLLKKVKVQNKIIVILPYHSQLAKSFLVKILTDTKEYKVNKESNNNNKQINLTPTKQITPLMFSLSDIEGIQLQRLVSYITQKNKQQKRNNTYLQTSNNIQLNEYSMNQQQQNQKYQIQSSDEEQQIDTINQTDKDDHVSNKQKNSQINFNNTTSSMMITEVNRNSASSFGGKQSPKQAKNEQSTNSNSKKLSKKSSNNSNMSKVKKQQRNKTKTKKISTRLHHNNHHLRHQPINMKSIMLSLKNHTIDHLKQQFIYNDNKITLQKFIFLMKQCISFNQSQQYQIYYELIKLFEQIDIDANSSIDWQQFLQYLACYGWTNSSASGDNSSGGNNQNNFQDNPFQKDKKSSLVVQNWKQTNKHRSNIISKLVQIERLDMLCLIQSKHFVLSFLNTRGDKYRVIEQKKHKDMDMQDDLMSMEETNKKRQMQQQQQQQGSIMNNNNKYTSQQLSTQKVNSFSINHIDPKRVLSIDYSQDEKLFGILQTDRKVFFIQEGQIQKSWGIIQGMGNQIQIIYLNLHKKWLLKRIDQYIDIFASPKQKNDKQRISFKPHQKQALTAIKELKNPLSLMTSGIDGKIKIWSLAGRQLLIQLKPIGQQEMLSTAYVKTMGVKGIDTLNIGIQSYFCSWTFNTEIMLWLPSASISKPYIGKLHGHSGIVQSCQFVKPQHTTQETLVSIDNKKVVKIWSVEKLQCLHSFLHQGNGCRIKCLNSKPCFIVYDKIMEFYKLKLNSMFATVSRDKQSLLRGGITNKSSKQYSSQLQNLPENTTTSSSLIQVGFCSYSILILLLLSTQLRIINLQSGKIQALFQPTQKDQQELIHMSIKINRRVFILSSFGYVYYVKLDDGSLIQKIHVKIQQKQSSTGSNFHQSSKTGINKYQYKSKQLQNKQLKFTPRFVYYHVDSKILLVIVETQRLNSSVLLTYDQNSGYQFQKMKQIQFQQSDLISFSFFVKNDIFLIVSETMITIWDWNKVAIVNRLDFDIKKDNFINQLKNIQNKHPLYLYNKDTSYVKHFQANQSNSNNSYLIFVLNRYDEFRIYQLNSVDFSIKTMVSLQVQSKYKGSLTSFYFSCTMNEQIQSMVVAKVGIKKSRKNINLPGGNTKQKQVKFNFSSVQDQQTHTKDKLLQLKNHHKQQVDNFSLQKNQSLKIAQNTSNDNKSKQIQQQQNILINKNNGSRQNKILYFVTRQGSLIAYNIGEIIGSLRRQHYQGRVHFTNNSGNYPTGEQMKNSISVGVKFGGSGLNNTIIVQNILMNTGSLVESSKKYAVHKIRQTRKGMMKKLLTLPHVMPSVDLQEYLLYQKQMINNKWTSKFGQIYKDSLYSLNQKKQLYIFKATGEVLAEWSMKVMNPKKWEITYQVLPKILQRLNRLQWILNIYNRKNYTSSNKARSSQQQQSYLSSAAIDGSELYKVWFLANRYLQESDITQLREYVKMSTVKTLNISKKNILYKKGISTNYNQQKQLKVQRKQIKSLKRMDIKQDKYQNKKNVTISKQVIQHNDKKQKLIPSINNINLQQANGQTNSNNNNRSPLNNNQNRLSPLPLTSFSAKKRDNNQDKNLSNNYFDRKFQQRIQQETRLKVHKRFIQRQVQSTLQHAQKLNLKCIQNHNMKVQHSQSSQKGLKLFVKSTKEQAKKLLLNTNNQPILTEFNSGEGQSLLAHTNMLQSTQTNHLMLQQEMQKKQIQKNIDFVRKIQNSIQKIEMNYNMWGRDNQKIFINQKSQKQLKTNGKSVSKNVFQKKNTYLNNNLVPNNTKTSHNRKISTSTNNRSRKASISENIPDNINEKLIMNNIKSNFKLISQKQDLKSQIKNDTLQSLCLAIPSSVKQTQQIINSNTKKNVGFLDSNNLLTQLDSRKSYILEEQSKKKLIQQNNLNQNQNKPIRSFSSTGKHQKNDNQNYKKSGTPDRINLQSALNNQSKQKQFNSPVLRKSQSVHGSKFVQGSPFTNGGQFNKQKQLGLSNFKQGMREFQNFYKKFGNSTYNSQKNKNSNRIKLN